VRIALITDGQVDLQNDGNTLDSRLKLEQVGGLQAAQGFKGQLSVTAVASGTSVISRVGGNAVQQRFDGWFKRAIARAVALPLCSVG